ncbi:putative mitochondrial protein [Tanacetum coccineum]
MTKITDLESELKGYRKDVDDRFNAVEGRFNALEKDFNGKHAELLAAIQSLTNQVQGLTSQSPKPSKNKEQPKHGKKLISQNKMLGFSREGMKFGTGSNGNGEYFRVQGNGLQPGMRSNGAEYRLRKLKMPIFKGEDAYGWIYRMERYFHIQGIEATDQLTAAELCLEGQALSWYRWSDGRTPFRSWENFKRRLLDRFQQSQEGSLYEQFLAITQDGSAREYVALFEKLARQLVGVPETILEGTFIKGLKQDLRAAVRVLNPEGLSHAMKLAVSIEENQLFGSASQGGGSYRTNSTTNYSNRISGSGSTRTLVSTAPIEHKTGSVSSVSTMRSSQFKRLTESEMAEKRSKGLCFKCDEKYGPGHQCKSKSLQVLWVDEEDAYQEDEPFEHEHLDSVEVSLNSVIGLTSPRTMKIRGTVGETEVVVLIDCGATHNFVSWHLIEKAGLVVSGSNSVGVILGNGKVEKAQGICKGILISLPELQVVDDFLPLELGSTDAILGMKWLQTLGEMTVNWKKLTMVFNDGNKQVAINGDPGLCRNLVSVKSIARSIKHEKYGFLVEMKQMEEEDSIAHHPGEIITELLTDFDEVFHMPNGLPPQRDHEHSIVLKEGTEPISVRPYRYPHAQKSEIERLVSKMLQAGVIQPSSSPFSSPVLLVKKRWKLAILY